MEEGTTIFGGGGQMSPSGGANEDSPKRWEAEEGGGVSYPSILWSKILNP